MGLKAPPGLDGAGGLPLRTLLVSAAVLALALAPTVLAVGTTTVGGTLAAWVPAAAVVQAGDAVTFTSLDVAHVGFVHGLVADDVDADGSPDYGSTTRYSNLPRGSYPFECINGHPWMVGRLVVV